MNANELADKLMGWADDVYGGGETLIEAATMLRQQADLIRNLQKSLGFKNSGYETINLTPQLELTDEEIHDLIINKTTDADMIKQALRKAQEK
jgi:hypothetical protein